MAELFLFLGAIYYSFFTLDTENLTTEQNNKLFNLIIASNDGGELRS